MKQITALLVLVGILTFSACKDEDNTNNTDSNKTTDTNTVVVNPDSDTDTDADTKRDSDSFYIHLNGTAGATEAGADMFKQDDNIVLVYYADNEKENITFTGKMRKDGKMNLKSIKSEVKKPVTIDATLKGKKLSGTLTSAGKDSPLELKENYKNSEKFKSFNFFDELKDGDEQKYFMQMVYFQPENKTIADTIYKHYFTEEAQSAKNVDEAMKLDNESFLSYYKEAQNDEMYMGWNRNIISDIVYNDKSFLCYAIHWDEFSGGAHPNYSSSFYIFDLKTSKLLKTADILANKDDKFWSDLIYNTLKTDREISDEEMADTYFELPIKPGESIYITNYGIGFSYSPYEIAPYVSGPDDVFFPFTKEILGKLKPEIANRLK